MDVKSKISTRDLEYCLSNKEGNGVEILLLDREPVLNPGTATQKSVLGRQVRVGKGSCFIEAAGNLGRWWTNISKTIFPIQVKLESWRGLREGKDRG